jgi:hypothetical protein
MEQLKKLCAAHDAVHPKTEDRKGVSPFARADTRWFEQNKKNPIISAAAQEERIADFLAMKVPIGKYRGKTFQEVIVNDRSYMEWYIDSILLKQTNELYAARDHFTANIFSDVLKRLK